jgi:hypothetical protein
MRINLTVLLLLIPVPALAWGAKPHRIIADIAQRQLAAACPGALIPTLTTLDVNHLADVAAAPDTWPENVGAARIGLWHFVNIPYDSQSYDSVRDCPANICTIGGINFALEIMNHGEPKAESPVQREALMLLIHLTGDLYQPLHCATSVVDPQSIRVTVNGTHVPGNRSGSGDNDNLHFVWDVSLVEWRHLTEDEYVDYLFRRVAKGELGVGSYTPIPKAAEYSHTFALDGIKNVVDHTDLKPDYMNSNADVVDQQLVYAGTELAELIKLAWQSKLDLSNCKP